MGPRGFTRDPRAEWPETGDRVAALRDPAAYAGRPTAVDVVETHFAWVFLTGQHAYKLKKPLFLKGADLRTLEARERNCREELRINRRLAASTYLDVVPLTVTGERIEVKGAGRTVDWLVVMRQLDRDLMLDAVLRAGRLVPDDLDRVVGTLVGFYHRLQPELVTPAAYVESVHGRVDEALRELARHEFGVPLRAVQALGDALAKAFDGISGQLARRAREERIVEAHGDLRAEHVWLGRPVQVIDALEFDRRLRVLDPAEEIMMLVVDVERLGFPAAGRDLVGRYLSAMPDPAPVGLLAFYESLRAATRAKVAIWHLEDSGQCPDPAPWRRRALEFISHAIRVAGRVR